MPSMRERANDLIDALTVIKRQAHEMLEPGRETALVATKIDEAMLWLLRCRDRDPR